MKKYLLVLTAVLTFALLVGCGNAPVENPEYTVAENGEQIIDETTAMRAAAEKASLNVEEIRYTNVAYGASDNGSVYDVSFLHDGFEYVVEVDATNGAIESFEQKEITGIISEDDALAAALVKAELGGIGKEELTDYEIELDKEHGEFEYEIEFVYGGVEYEIVINAADGSVKEFETEDKNVDDIDDDDDIPVAVPDKVIGEDAALNAALAKAELVDVTKEELEFCNIKFDEDDGTFVYEVDFGYNGVKYEVTVNCVSGEVIEFEIDEKDHDKKPEVPENNDTTVAPEHPEDKPVIGDGNVGGGTDKREDSDVSVPSEEVTDGLISEKDAFQIALEHSGVEESTVEKLHIDFDKEHGRTEYEIEFISGYTEYDYDIDALTGEIINFDREAESCNAPDYSHPGEDEFIGEENAKAAAFAHAGVDAANVYDVEIELDRGKGIFKYELEFRSGDYEYEYDINALDGSVIKFSKEIDD